MDLDSFVAQFTQDTIGWELERTQYFIPGVEHSKKAPLLYKSQRLGVSRGKKFIPSLNLLSWLLPRTQQIAVLNDHAAWLFICGNNVLKEGILACATAQGKVLVCNAQAEVIGCGRRTGAGITNEFNIGYFLHRER